MKQLKEYLTEGNFFGNLGIGKKNVIEDWLKKYNIKKYNINNDWTIDVNGEVDLRYYPDKELPDYIQFNYVKIFNISNSNINTLKGVPNKCLKFKCSECNSLTSLEGAPKECKLFFSCNGCINLISLKGAPKECKEFCCDECESLTSLEGAPEKCEGFYSYYCTNLTSLEGAPIKCEKFNCRGCTNLTSLKGAPKECKEFCCFYCKGNFTEEDVKKVCNAKIIKC